MGALEKTAAAEAANTAGAGEAARQAVALANLRGLMASEIAQGYATAAGLRQWAEISADVNGLDLDAAAVDAMIAAAVAARRAEEAAWPRTDNDRLDDAMAALEAVGIVARQHWACCQSCGIGSIVGELTDEDWGYCFFHAQSTNSAIESGVLNLSFGSAVPAEGDDDAEYAEATRGVGEVVAQALRAEGLMVAWSGAAARQIEVTGLVWRRRCALVL